MKYPPGPPTLYNDHQTADILGLKSQTLRTWRCMGKGPKYLKIGGAVRYHPSDIDDYIEQCKRENTSQT